MHHTYDRYSMVDLEAPDLGLWPKAPGLRGLSVILQPGDVLFVPQYWWARPAAWLRPAAAALPKLQTTWGAHERVARECRQPFALAPNQPGCPLLTPATGLCMRSTWSPKT